MELHLLSKDIEQHLAQQRAQLAAQRETNRLLSILVEIVSQEGRQIDKVSSAYTELLGAMDDNSEERLVD